MVSYDMDLRTDNNMKDMCLKTIGLRVQNVCHFYIIRDPYDNLMKKEIVTMSLVENSIFSRVPKIMKKIGVTRVGFC